jgi:hypothetical protein
MSTVDPAPLELSEVEEAHSMMAPDIEESQLVEEKARITHYRALVCAPLAI